MKFQSTTNRILNYCIAAIWVANGLFCKVLNLVPRHEQIVARILGNSYSRPLTLAIGILEILMAIWILSRIKQRLNAITQMLIIAVMNVIEFSMAPDLLLFGQLNIVFAFMLIHAIYLNEFKFNKAPL